MRLVLTLAFLGTALHTRDLSAQAKGWVLDSVIDRTTGEVTRQVVAAGENLNAHKRGAGILMVTCYHHRIVVTLTSVIPTDLFDGSQGTVNLHTRYDDGPEVVEVWPLPPPGLEAVVEGAPALALARELSRHEEFAVEYARSETFKIQNKGVLKALLAGCVP